MRTLTDPIAVAAKAAVAVAGSLALVRALGLQDAISATFAALVCVSPVAVTGLRLGVRQVVSSAIGGLITALILAVLGPSSPVLAAAMGLTLWTVFRAGLGSGYLFAGFTVIYVFLVPASSPTIALWQRLAALTAGMVVATVVNTAVSAVMYRSIFDRRLALVREVVANALARAASGAADPAQARDVESSFDAAFPVVWSLGAELSDAQRDGWLRRRSRPSVDAAFAEVRALARLVHVGKELGLQLESSGAPDAVFAAALDDLAVAVRERKEPVVVLDTPIHRRAVAALAEANEAAAHRAGARR